jgi:hypothetical protein
MNAEPGCTPDDQTDEEERAAVDAGGEPLGRDDGELEVQGPNSK